MGKQELKKLAVEAVKSYNSKIYDYVGAMYTVMFSGLCQPYKVYYKDNNLSYSDCSVDFDKVRREVKKKIDPSKTIKNAYAIASRDDRIETVCLSSNEFLVVGSDGDCNFIIDLTNGDPNYYENIYTNDITKAFSIAEGLFIGSVEKTNLEFGIAAMDQSQVYTTWYDFNAFAIDIEKNYNDDFKSAYEKICELIEQPSSSSLMLLYGAPGTGKTSLIKHLITKYDTSEFIFIDGSLLANASPEKLMTYFLDNSNTVFVLEDCEKSLVSRDSEYNPIIPVLLNLTDGIIGDALGLKMICTFNTSLSKIDKALLRKGRLSLKYEFKPLDAKKASLLIGNDTSSAMTLADIYAREENDFSKSNTKKIGFV